MHLSGKESAARKKLNGRKKMDDALEKSCVLKARGNDILPFDGKSERAAAAFCRLFELARILRSKEGCPWDREQTPRSMRSALIDETFETVDAVSEGDAEHAKEELGDLFFNATLVCTMFDEYGQEGGQGFSVEDALDGVCQKLIRRHPHVFGGQKEADVKEALHSGKDVLPLWDKIKEDVEGRKSDCVLDSVPKEYPPLLKACKYQKKASKKGFVWPDADGALCKMEEELSEVKSALSEGDASHLEEECGDFLFAAVNYVRMLGVDPVLALNGANKKFYSRFSYVQKKCEELGLSQGAENLERMKDFWNEAKAKL